MGGGRLHRESGNDLNRHMLTQCIKFTTFMESSLHSQHGDKILPLEYDE
jgi:hypothetical protein